MSLHDEDDSSYVQQQWEGLNNEHEIQEILSQFNVNQELRNLQMNFFGVSDNITDPQLQLPNNMELLNNIPKLNNNKEPSYLGKRNNVPLEAPLFEIQTPENTIQPLPVPVSNKRQKVITKGKKKEEIENEGAPKQTRECHNMNERQRRLKINQKIQDLKELLPKNCADILTNKLAILHESVEHIRNLHHLVDHLTERNYYLEQRLSLQEKELLNLRVYNENNANNTSDSSNNSIVSANNTSSSNSVSSPPAPQYQRQLPSNSIASSSYGYNLLSPFYNYKN